MDSRENQPASYERCEVAKKVQDRRDGKTKIYSTMKSKPIRMFLILLTFEFKNDQNQKHPNLEELKVKQRK